MHEDAEDDSADGNDSDFTLTRRKRLKPKRAKRVEPQEPRTYREKSLKFLLESSKFRWNLPIPSNRDPPARTYGCNYFQQSNAELVPSRWPPDVLHLADNFNPYDIPVPGSAPFEKCTCSRHGDCRWGTCANSLAHIYCDALCCPFEGLCGIGTSTNPNVQLMRTKNTDFFTLRATKHIGAGVVLGEYLGFLSLVPGGKREPQTNEGFRLHFQQDLAAWGSRVLCVDARIGGSLMRFLNHSCAPSAKFNKVANLAGRTIVVTTLHDIFAGEEITVDYGDDLWFDCRCKVCGGARGG